MASYLVRADVATIDQIDAAVTAKADTLNETMPDADRDDRRRARRAVMANPGADPGRRPHRPAARRSSSTCTATPAPDRRARPPRGPRQVTEAWITRVLGPRAGSRSTPVLDLAGQAPVDAYEIPDRHRQAVHLMTPADTFPFASSLSRRAGRPHRPLRPGRCVRHGQLRADDHPPPPDQDPRRLAGPATLPRHLRLARPSRRLYLVDHTGTRRLPQHQPRSSRSTAICRASTTPPPDASCQSWQPVSTAYAGRVRQQDGLVPFGSGGYRATAVAAAARRIPSPTAGPRRG